MEWISVNERLPEDHTNCVIWSETSWFDATYSNGEFFINDAFGEPFSTVATYWFVPTNPKP